MTLFGRVGVVWWGSRYVQVDVEDAHGDQKKSSMFQLTKDESAILRSGFSPSSGRQQGH